MTEFVPWPKTARYFRDIVVSEKIDGTNSAIRITDDGTVYTQSRKRMITPEDDNFGFARWAAENGETLVRDLGSGLHFGEWWGRGIQRGYGLNQKLFSLFNTSKWQGVKFETPQLRCVPVLYEGPHSQGAIEEALRSLNFSGSLAAEFEGVEYYDAEGICIFHTAANMVFKTTLVNDESPKGAQ